MAPIPPAPSISALLAACSITAVAPNFLLTAYNSHAWLTQVDGERRRAHNCEGLRENTKKRKKKKIQEFVLQPGNIARADFSQPHAENEGVRQPA